MSEIKCPHCNEGIHYQMSATVPDEQILHFSIECENEFISAQTVAGAIKNMDSLLKSVAKDLDTKVHVFIKTIEQADGKLTVGFLITKVKS